MPRINTDKSELIRVIRGSKFHPIGNLRVFALVFAEETVTNQLIERLLNNCSAGFYRQVSEPPLDNPRQCVLRFRIFAQILQDRLHSLSYTWFFHRTCRRLHERLSAIVRPCETVRFLLRDLALRAKNGN
jgi:hypothetical protein